MTIAQLAAAVRVDAAYMGEVERGLGEQQHLIPQLLDDTADQIAEGGAVNHIVVLQWNVEQHRRPARRAGSGFSEERLRRRVTPRACAHREARVDAQNLNFLSVAFNGLFEKPVEIASRPNKLECARRCLE